MVQRKFLVGCALTVLFLGLAGCGHDSAKSEAHQPKPIVKGMAISGTLWDTPPMPAPQSRKGSGINGCEVEIYESCVVVISSDGSKRIAPLNYFTDLAIK